MNIGALTVTLGADVKGLLSINDAMLKVQQQMLISVNKINASLDRMTAVSVESSKKMASTNKSAQESIRAEMTKTAAKQESLKPKGNYWMGPTSIGGMPPDQFNKMHQGALLEEKERNRQILIAEKAEQAKLKAIQKAEMAALRERQKATAAEQKERNRQVQITQKAEQAKVRAVQQAEAAAQKVRAAAQTAAYKQAMQIIQEGKKTAAASAAQMVQAPGLGVAGVAKQWEQGLAMMSQRIRTFGYLASATLTLPIITAGKAILDTAKKYEFAIQKIVGLTGTAQDVANNWSKDILALAPAIGKAPQELAEALYFISSSGIKGAEALDVLKISAKASASGLGETQTVADLLTSALNAYAGTGLSAAKAADVLVAAVREGKGEAAGFASAMGQIIPIASTLGVSFDQVAGGMAAITLTGSSTASAAVYLKGVFNSLLTASTQGEKALGEMKTSYAELRDILANEGLVPLLQKLRDIQMAPRGEELLSDVLPNIRALTGYLSIAGKNFQYNKEMMDRVSDSAGSLNRAYIAIEGTMQQRLNRANAQLKVSMIALGQAVGQTVIPILQRLVDWVSRIVARFDALSDSQKRFRVSVAIVVAALGPMALLLSTIGYLFTAVIGGVRLLWVWIPKIIKGIRDFGVSMKLAFVTNPIMMTIGAIVLLGTVIAAVVIKLREYKKTQQDILADQVKEQQIINGLFTRYTDMTLSTKQRGAALLEINNRYGQYLDNLLTEASNVYEVEDAYKKVNKAVYSSIALKANAEKLQEKTAKTSKVFSRLLGKYAESVQMMNPDLYADFITEVYASADKAIDQGTGKLNQTILESERAMLWDKFMKPIMGDGQIKKGLFFQGIQQFTEEKQGEFAYTKNVKYLTKALEEMTVVADDAAEAMKSVAMPGAARGGFVQKEAQKIWDEMKAQEERFKRLQESSNKLGLGFSYDSQMLSEYTKAFEDLTGLLKNSTDPAILYVAAALKKTQQSLDDTKDSAKTAKEALADYTKAMEGFGTFADKLATVDAMAGYNLPLEVFDEAKEKLKVYENELNRVLSIIQEQKGVSIDIFGMPGSGAVVMTAYLEKLVAGIKKYNDLTTSTDQVDALTLVNRQAQAWGNLDSQIELVNYQLQQTERDLKDAFSAKTMNPDTIAKLKQQYTDLTLSLTDLQNQQALQYFQSMSGEMFRGYRMADLYNASLSAMENELQALSAAGMQGTQRFSDLSKQFDTLLQVQKVADALSGAFSDMFTSILDGGKNFSEIMLNMVKQLVNQMITELMRAALYKLALSLFGAVAGGGAGAGFADMMFQATGGFGMAKGGIVPSGYPNDSFPARLSSNEAVIPLTKLNLEKQQTVVVSGDVRFEIEGNRLVGILKKETFKNSTY